eukprot:scaffold296149_cov21-Prasinocladus_malaysianus.AAC.2
MASTHHYDFIPGLPIVPVSSFIVFVGYYNAGAHRERGFGLQRGGPHHRLHAERPEHLLQVRNIGEEEFAT